VAVSWGLVLYASGFHRETQQNPSTKPTHAFDVQHSDQLSPIPERKVRPAV
jgi:hypothetical protein